MNANKPHKTPQPQSGVKHSERILQLLCLIAQSLRRIEAQLGNIAGLTPQRQTNNIVPFNAGGRQ
jgi:hypothetical protein